MVDFKDRVAVITGGTGALGRAVVLDLLKAGARVAVPYLGEAGWRLLQTSAGNSSGGLTGAPADLNHSPDVEAFTSNVLEHYGRIDFLVCVAGGFAAGKSFETDD